MIAVVVEWYNDDQVVDDMVVVVDSVEMTVVMMLYGDVVYVIGIIVVVWLWCVYVIWVVALGW